MKKVMYVKSFNTNFRNTLSSVLRDFPEYEVSATRFQPVLPNFFILSGVDDRIDIHAQNNHALDHALDDEQFYHELTNHIKATRFNHFPDYVPEEIKNKLLDFALEIKRNFISSFYKPLQTSEIYKINGIQRKGYTP